MFARFGLVAVALVVVAAALWHPAPHPAFQTIAPPSPASGAATGNRRRAAQAAAGGPVVYVAGAVRRPGLYRLRSGQRVADAVERAGGLSAPADPAAVNLAAHANDGDEIYVPAIGERAAAPASSRRTGKSRGVRRRTAAAGSAPPATGEIDVNAAQASELTRVPGIGRAIAQRIVEMRASTGAFASLDELLDVSGMTQTRLERARPFLRPP